jgi:hypothetical protein
VTEHPVFFQAVIGELRYGSVSDAQIATFLIEKIDQIYFEP